MVSSSLHKPALPSLKLSDVDWLEKQPISNKSPKGSRCRDSMCSPSTSRLRKKSTPSSLSKNRPTISPSPKKKEIPQDKLRSIRCHPVPAAQLDEPQLQSDEIEVEEEFERSSSSMGSTVADFPFVPERGDGLANGIELGVGKEIEFGFGFGFGKMEMKPRIQKGRISNESEAAIRDVIFSPQLGESGSPNPGPFEFDERYYADDHSASESRASYSPISHLSTPGTVGISPFPEDGRHRFSTNSSQGSFQTPGTDHFSFQKHRNEISQSQVQRNDEDCNPPNPQPHQLQVAGRHPSLGAPSTKSSYYSLGSMNSYHGRVEGWVEGCSSPHQHEAGTGWQDPDLTQTELKPQSDMKDFSQDQISSPFVPSASTLMSPIKMDDTKTPTTHGSSTSALLQAVTSILPETSAIPGSSSLIMPSVLPLKIPPKLKTTFSAGFSQPFSSPSFYDGSSSASSLLDLFSHFEGAVESKENEQLLGLERRSRGKEENLSFGGELKSKENLSGEKREGEIEKEEEVGDLSNTSSRSNPDGSNSSIKLSCKPIDPRRGGWTNARGEWERFLDSTESLSKQVDEGEKGDEKVDGHPSNCQGQGQDQLNSTVMKSSSTLESRSKNDVSAARSREAASKIRARDASNMVNILASITTPTKSSNSKMTRPYAGRPKAGTILSRALPDSTEAPTSALPPIPRYSNSNLSPNDANRIRTPFFKSHLSVDGRGQGGALLVPGGRGRSSSTPPPPTQTLYAYLEEADSYLDVGDESLSDGESLIRSPKVRLDPERDGLEF